MNDRQLRACISTHLINPNPLSFYFLSVLRSYTRSLFVQFLLFFFIYIYIPIFIFLISLFFILGGKKKKKEKKKKQKKKKK
jgi:phosphotransferase system  glucose/maltose/N-acetylglucosamine-specific IIC component